jgi:hypothetical protein
VRRHVVSVGVAVAVAAFTGWHAVDLLYYRSHT